MLNNKKGFGIQVYGLIIAFLVALFAFFYFRATIPSPEFEFIGKTPLQILEVSQEGFNALNYIHLSAPFSLNQSIYELTLSGEKTNKGCLRSNGVSVWADITKEGDNFVVKECYPEEQELKENLIFYFNKDLNEYLALYSDAFIPGEYDYEISSTDNSFEITAKAKDKIQLSILKATEEPSAICPPKGEMIKSPMQPEKNTNIDIKTIEQCYPEVMEKYEELCKNIIQPDRKNYKAPEACLSSPAICCITSGYRHPAYNNEIGGSTNSQHQYGTAIDVYMGNVGMKEKIRWAMEAEKVGFTGIGIYPDTTHIHIDIRNEKTYFVWQDGESVPYDSLNDIESKWA